MPRVINVGLERIKLNEDILAELMAGVEERIRSYLRRKLRRRVDEFEIIVRGEYKGDELDVLVDVRVVGKAIGPISYEEVIAEAIEEAGRWLEERLRALRGGAEREGSEGAPGDTGD
ncbi:hypothetical protein [Pyrolobus fumarii]|uniref:hypothetical protein n=1 Tax=Pyrolobus fumarii TaxID=54252 RepID=UPI001432FAE4|nr:hypothetical protein [Pyrolobus fumarii]